MEYFHVTCTGTRITLNYYYNNMDKKNNGIPMILHLKS